MSNRKNPFEYEGANNLPADDIIDFYIEDFNFSRFIQSTKNIFLLGERGSGKTMTLLYNSFKIQYKKAKRDSESPDFSKIGIHIPCNTPLFHKKEYLLLENDFKKSIVCEHYLVLSIVYAIADTLAEIPELNDAIKDASNSLFQEMEYMLGMELNKEFGNFFMAVKKFAYKEIINTQQQINSYDGDEFYENAMSFSSIVIPFIEIIKSVDILKNSHFLLMIDDAQDMNVYQIKNLNSWIAYRDHSHFSFKVATTKVNRPKSITSTGGSILEGHDFISIDMEKPFQKKGSEFYEMAKSIIKKRLENVTLNDIDAETFFPENAEYTKAMEAAREKARKDAETKYPTGTAKQINDYIYKYTRAEYYRSRAKKANLPPYSGFSMIVDVSTGVIRNLLDPCYWMYDAQLSAQTNAEPIGKIPPQIQDEIIINRSKQLWEIMRTGLDKQVEDCSELQSKQIYQLFDNLMILFKRRLLEHKSEPRAIVFSISQLKCEDLYDKLQELLNIARKAQLLYIRTGNAKDLGKQEVYYVPNRLLFPSRGLDPHGQYSRVSLKVTDLWNAAKDNTSIPFSDDDKEEKVIQHSIFDDYE